MQFSIRIPLICTIYLLLTAWYSIVNIDSIWMNVLWGCYKNLFIVASFYFFAISKKLLFTDKIFLWSSIIVNVLQSAMYVLCPFSTTEQKLLYFNVFGWFCILMALSSLGYYYFSLRGSRNKLD